MTPTTELHPGTGIVFDRVGSGPPLVMLHGLGGSRTIWRPVMEGLTPYRDLVMVDLPGFGETPPLPEDVEPNATQMAEVVVQLLDDLGLDRPHLAGHSFGGWVALEIAALGRASSVTAVAPAGLWDRSMPPTTRYGLRGLRLVAKRLGGLAPALVGSAAARTALLWPQSGKPWALRPEWVINEVHDFAHCPGFEATLQTMVGRRFTSKASLDVPISVGFGSRDVIVDRWQSQDHSLLPASARWVSLPACGHTPMWDDPVRTAQLLLDGSSAPLRPMRHPRAGRSY